MSDRVLDQVAAEVLNEFGALKLESILKSVVKIADSYFKLGFKLLPVMSTAGRRILIGRLPRDFDVELLDPNSASLQNLVEFLLVRKVRMIE